MNNCHRFQVFFDGDCPLCRREIEWLQRRDRHGKIMFVDIAAEDFQPDQWGKTYEQLMAEIHGRQPDGQWVTGVEVFRHLYQAAGLGWLVSMSRQPGVRHTLDLGYRVFARYRTRLTGRCHEGTCQVKPSANGKRKVPELRSQEVTT
jgi:predicted DCC family thiol-disulfide oxidoreductase YuxK